MQTVTEYKVMLSDALNVGVTAVEVKEIVYQARAIRRHRLVRWGSCLR